MYGRFRKYLDKTEDIASDLGLERKKAIFLSDSKGKRLKEQVDQSNRIENNIHWMCEPGITSEIGISWFLGELKRLLRQFGTIALYVHLGTCDLTEKFGRVNYSNCRRIPRFIRLRATYASYGYKIVENFRNLMYVANDCNFSITFLEIPIYSIKEYNRSLGHPNPDIFDEQDRKLATELEHINQKIRDLNTVLGTRSPRFNLDIERNRKKPGRRSKYRYSFSAYYDGVHPIPLLSKFWLRRVSELIKVDCY